MIKEFKTRTGAIFCDTEKRLEWLYVGDYGKNANIKANFLGLTKEINGVEHRPVNLEDKMVVTISTQKGCPMKCRFCDCPGVKFGGNATFPEMAMEIYEAIKSSGCKHTKRFNLHLARMGEPSFNYDNVKQLLDWLPQIVETGMSADVIHPVFTTMMPKDNSKIDDIVYDFCEIKNLCYVGEAGLQLSINSTDDAQRDWLFNGRSMSLGSISRICDWLPLPIGRKYTLNFPVTKDTILDPAVLDNLFDKDKFIVKITPIHATKEAEINNIETAQGYADYDVYRKFEQPLLEHGWDVIVFIPSMAEDEDRITCGNALLSQMR